MKNLNNVAEDLFNKIRGRFPSVTIGDAEGTVTTVPEESRFYDFGFTTEGAEAGKVSISLDEENGITVIVGKDIVENQPQSVKSKWFDFLRELRQFAKKRMLQFDVRDITKSNLQKRDYKHLAATRPGEDTMAESKMYGTNRTSYQRIGNARLAIKHTAPVNMESSTGRTQKIGSIFIESPDGEKFRYPFVHLSGARAMARHVSEGGNAYDDFGKYISGLSEELSKLRKFNTYINRSGVMAETLGGYSDIVKERAGGIRKEIQNLQKEGYYREAVDGYSVSIVEDVPEDVAENWIDQLTIKQFNEELKDVFPYIYKLVGEATRAKELGPEDLEEAVAKIACVECDEVSTAAAWKKNNNFCPKCKTSNKGVAEAEEVDESFSSKMNKAAKKAHADAAEKRKKMGPVTSDTLADINAKLGNTKSSKKKTKEEFELEQAFEDTMGQFADAVCEDCGNPSWRTLSETEKQKGVDGKVCWKGYKRMGTKMKGGRRVDNCVKIKEADLEEAYINTSKDAIDTLGALRKIGKKIETGQDTFDGNLANMYANDVYDVISWVENNLDTNEPNYQKVLGPVIELRKKAKSMERELGSGKDARFGNQIVNTLYPLMQWIEMNAQGTKEGNAFAHAVRQAKMSGKKKGDKISGPDGKEITLEKEAKTPLGEFILSYFDRESGKFPKGETAVLTAVEKDYGDEYVEPARQFIEQVQTTTLEYLQREAAHSRYPETEMIKRLAGM